MLKPSLVTLTATIFNESAFRDIWAVTGGSTDRQLQLSYWGNFGKRFLSDAQ